MLFSGELESEWNLEYQMFGINEWGRFFTVANDGNLFAIDLLQLQECYIFSILEQQLKYKLKYLDTVTLTEYQMMRETTFSKTSKYILFLLDYKIIYYDLQMSKASVIILDQKIKQITLSEDDFIYIFDEESRFSVVSLSTGQFVFQINLEQKLQDRFVSMGNHVPSNALIMQVNKKKLSSLFINYKTQKVVSTFSSILKKQNVRKLDFEIYSAKNFYITHESLMKSYKMRLFDVRKWKLIKKVNIEKDYSFRQAYSFSKVLITRTDLVQIVEFQDLQTDDESYYEQHFLQNQLYKYPILEKGFYFENYPYLLAERTPTGLRLSKFKN